MAIEMSELARELTGSRLRAEHPQWDEKRVSAEMLRGFIPDGHPAAP
jgi:hypothetical protein